ncbi:MAG: hypothetical protein H0T73_03070 [Ardenticatenales bacterium]|nr:hypothetical protein [Ardenticatenales bacterium]
MDTDDTPCQILLWPDGGITRCWLKDTDSIPDKDLAEVLFNDALPPQDLVVLAYDHPEASNKGSVRFLRTSVGSIPFSHYFPKGGGESLAIAYSSPNRRNASPEIEFMEGQGEANDVPQEIIDLEKIAAEAEATPNEEIADLPMGAKLSLLAPRGMKLLDAKLVKAAEHISIHWKRQGREKLMIIPGQSRGKKVTDDITAEALKNAGFRIG